MWHLQSAIERHVSEISQESMGGGGDGLIDRVALASRGSPEQIVCRRQLRMIKVSSATWPFK
ncbi:hypothetical protein B723_09150 [Pseudomonas fluorescens NCIMB 11764]|uniref:Uncharacterized protein n=1 Tax=Pseudomonas fluorescens NCIMB 11764 TaxID=1221522 RepID=A0A0K1QLM2_PSEFL|nr:hypothetical protein B723_09150 [Pseudomonas fluorescens NCIMB 11764]